MAGGADNKTKVAIVTGSTQGLGEAIARRLVEPKRGKGWLAS
jgi:NAD(P)-dependent dehydrogenase (short-subunit alcohol dehydrogenase family)